LARAEAMVDASGVAQGLEAALPVGPRPRQCSARTLLVGMALALAEGRPGHLCRVHRALLGLSEADRVRLGVVVAWKTGPHCLTYRQVEYTFGRVVAVLAKPVPDGTASEVATGVVDALVEASIPPAYKAASDSLAVDWTDQETYACGPGEPGGPSADAEASWGHRRGNHPGQRDEAFYGYYLSAATMVLNEGGASVPELIRRIALSTCSTDPVPVMVPVIEALVGSGVGIGDVLADSGYAHRVAKHWAIPLRRLGASIVTDLHPSDRGPHGTHQGAICSDGNLYCPAVPKAILGLAPLGRGADEARRAEHDATCGEAARYKLVPISGPDADGYRRAGCPALAGKLRCPLRSTSMALGYDRPTVASPPEHPPVCCSQASITVAPSVNAKTAQRHDYPGPAWRTSYARRSGVERSYSTLKDPASTDINRGWCRVMGLVPIMLFLTAAVMVRNLRIVDAFEARMAEDARRAEQGRPPRTRKRRRVSLADLADTG
jgi:hypothetical protein